jgi:hypothetical protein
MASAADLYQSAYKAPSPPVQDWSAVYVGVEGGYGWGHERFDAAFDPFLKSDPSLVLPPVSGAPTAPVPPIPFVINDPTISSVHQSGWLGGGFAGVQKHTQGATLEPVQGELWINHGKGFEKVLASKIEAKVGDSVMVSPGGIAKVSYADGCQANVKPGAVMIITKLSPCASGSLAADLTPVYKAKPAETPPAFWCEWPGTLLCLAPFGVLAFALTNNHCNNSTLYSSC